MSEAKPGMVSVVLPVYNEQDSLPPLDAELRAVLRTLDRPAELIWVDDGSRDDSVAVLQRLQREAAAAGGRRPRTRIVRLRRNFGQTTALAAGFDVARGEVIVALDADGQNNPKDIPRLLAKLDEEYDVVSGWRKERQDRAVSRRLPSWAANHLISSLSGVKLHDYGCTLKAYRSSLLERVHLHGEMHRFIPVFLARVGARITELVVDHRAREHGVSKYGADRILKVLLDLVTIRFISRYATRPMHFFGQAAVIFAMLVVATLSLMVVFKFGWLRWIGLDYQASFIQTPLPALAGTFLVGILVSLIAGILGEMLVHIHHDLRPPERDAIGAIEDGDGPGPSGAGDRVEDGDG